MALLNGVLNDLALAGNISLAFGDVRVFHLKPVARAAGAVARIPPLRDDAFEPELAGGAKHRLAVGSRRRSVPFSSMRSKAYRNTLAS